MRESNGLINTHLMIISAALLLLCSMSTCYAALGDELFRLYASDTEARDQFGRPVAVHGTTAIIGAWTADNATGSTYLFDLETGTETHKLVGSDMKPSDRFGFSVAIDSDYVVVGAAGDDHAGDVSGSAYVFDPVTGTEIRKLTASDATAGDWFGNSVAVSGTRAVVGAHGADAAYVYDLTTGEELRILYPSYPIDQQFGSSIDLYNNIAVVGASPSGSATTTGAAYIFDINTGTELFRLTPSDGGPGDRFGISVAIYNDKVLVGADGGGSLADNIGAAYLFDVTTGEELRIIPTPTDAENFFAYDVAVTSEFAVIGAYQARDEGLSTGAIYAFDLDTGDQVAKITASDGTGGALFGHAVAASNVYIIGGAPSKDDIGTDSGAAYAFEIGPFVPPILEDLNGDGFVGINDLNIILSNWNLFVPPGDPRADAGGVGGTGPDGFIGINDLNVVLGNWNAGSLPPVEASAVVPEPGSAALLAAGGAACLRRRAG